MKEGAEMSIYRTNVRFGVSLQNRAKSVSSLNTRYLLNDLNKYLYSDLSVNTPYYGKVCALYGLRRTGKTTMMLQSILGMTNEQFNKTAWIDVTEEDNMASLYLDLQKLNEQGYKYIFIDEITKVEQFVRVSSLLSDEFAISGIHIVLTGTDSLGISRRALYGIKPNAYFRIAIWSHQVAYIKESTYEFIFNYAGLYERLK